MSSGTQTTYFLSDTYNSIETLPYWNWDKIIQTGDLRFLCKKFTYDKFENSDKKKAIELSKFIDKLYKTKDKDLRELVVKYKKESTYSKKIKQYNEDLENKINSKIQDLGFKDHGILLRPDSKLSELWTELQDQHLLEFGGEGIIRSRIRSLKKLAKLNLRFLKSRDRSILNLIAVEEAKQKDSNSEHMSMYTLLDLMTTKKGFDIDPKKYTVIKWFHTLKNITNNGKNDPKG